MADGWLRSERNDDVLLIETGGSWTIGALANLDDALRDVLAEVAERRAHIALDALDRLDTAGAWLIYRTEQQLQELGLEVELAGAAGRHLRLLDRVREAKPSVPPVLPQPAAIVAFVEHVGRATLQVLNEARDLLAFLGLIVVTLARVTAEPSRLRVTPLVHHLEQAGLNAVPIVALLSYLIGIVLAYQGADQLRAFGAEIFTVNLLGVSVLRELGILLTAIIVAGRSGSAFTAQIGTMKVNEEVDAIRTLGLDEVELLVLPRLLALMIALPLLGFLANIMALLGGGLMTMLVLDIAPATYLSQLSSAVSVTTLWVGMVKAPVFAFLIAMVGCFEGLKVTGSAESVGRLTTQSVVVSIFLVIVVDALFSILFSFLGV